MTIHRSRFHALTLTLATSLAAFPSCAADADPTATAYTITDSAGIQIVESLTPVWGDTPLQIAPEPLLRLGSEEEGPEQFGSVMWGVLFEDGRIAVSELTSSEVRLFDSTGQHQRTFGGAGDGPGEFRSLGGLFGFRGDSIAVYDQRLRRTTIFSLSSGAQRTVPNQIEGNFYPFGILEGGHLLFYNRGAGYRPDLSPGLQWDTTDVVLIEPVEGSPTVVVRLPSRQQLILPDGNTELLAPGQWSIQAVADDGFYWATSDRYEIGFYDVAGTLRRILRRPVEPQAVRPEMIAEYIEFNLDRVRQSEGEAAVPRSRRRYEEGTYGEAVPLFARALVDGDQRLWVSESYWPSLGGVPRVWSVFSPEGMWLGDVEAPEGVRILDIRRDLVLGVWRDQFDVPYIQVHRLTR